MPPLEDTKEAFDWKQGAPSGTVLSAFCSYTRTTINYIWNALVSRLAAMIGVSTASVNAAGFWECYAEIELQPVAASRSVACGEFANGDFTSGHPFLPRTV
jgi:hypothetical protein